MPEIRDIIQIDEELCNGCGDCIPSCAEGALAIVDGKARLVADKYCDGLGACLGECPTGALKMIQRRADAFDEEAVEELLAATKTEADAQPMGCGCPSSNVKTFSRGEPARPRQGQAPESALAHWPVQLRLVNPEAPFLKDADLLITADCAPVATPAYHTEFLPGKVALLGCPKFDDAPMYVERIAEIARKGVKSITLLEMEVPCCQSLDGIVAAGLKKAQADIPVEKVVIACDGRTVSRGPLEQRPTMAAL